MVKSKQEEWLDGIPQWIIQPAKNMDGDQCIYFMKNAKNLEKVFMTIDDEFHYCLFIPNLRDSYESIYSYFLKKWQNQIESLKAKPGFSDIFIINESFLAEKYNPVEKKS